MKLSDLNFAELSDAIKQGDILTDMNKSLVAAACLIPDGNLSLLTSSIIQEVAIEIHTRIQSMMSIQLSELNFSAMSIAINEGHILKGLNESIIAAASMIPGGNLSLLCSQSVQKAVYQIHSRLQSGNY